MDSYVEHEKSPSRESKPPPQIDQPSIAHFPQPYLRVLCECDLW